MAKITGEERREYENKFRRKIVRHLTPLETKVMIYIIDRTIGWMKDGEKISYREFEEGRYGTFNCGVGVQKTSARRAVISLVSKGVVEIISSTKRQGTYIKVNLDWEEDEP